MYFISARSTPISPRRIPEKVFADVVSGFHPPRPPGLGLSPQTGTRNPPGAPWLVIRDALTKFCDPLSSSSSLATQTNAVTVRSWGRLDSGSIPDMDNLVRLISLWWSDPLERPIFVMCDQLLIITLDGNSPG